MFAAGRILRNRRESGVNGEVVGGLSLFVKRTKKPRRPFRCYFPVVWQALLASFIGFIIIIGGTIMCAIGYNVGQFPSERIDDTNNHTGKESQQVAVRDSGGLENLYYVGPVLMSFGCFMIVFSCVIIFETRDSVIEIFEDQEKRGLQKINVKIDFFKLVMEKKYNKAGVNRNTTYVISTGIQPSAEAAVAWPSDVDVKVSSGGLNSTKNPEKDVASNIILQGSELPGIS